MIQFLSSAVAGRFSPALEDAYQADLAGEKIRMAYVACLLAMFLYLSSAILDAGSLSGNVAGAWIVRTTAMLATAVVAAAIRLWPQAFLRHYTICVCAVAFGWAEGIEALILVSAPTDLAWSTYYAGLILVSMAQYTWTYLRPLHAGYSGMLVVGSYVMSALFVQGMVDGKHWALLGQNCFFLVSANMVGLVSMAMRERFSRQAFLLKNALAHDLKLEEEAKRQSLHLSEHDALTGLPNRLRFLRQLGELLGASHGTSTVGVLFLDLDSFKPVNDRYGHAAGDHVLAVVAERIRSEIRTSDLAARLGGDEFVIALPLTQYQSESIVERISAALCEAIAEPIDFRGSSLRVSASIGSAICVQGGVSAEQLIDLADRSMYEAKRTRNMLLAS